MATLTSTKIKNTYDALLKASDNDAIGSSAKQITDGLGNATPLYISTTQIGIGVTPESGLNLHVYGDAKIGSNLTVIGNLVVEGSTTTVGTDTLTVKDPLIVLANNNTSTDAVDIGFYGKYTPSGTTLYSGLFREALTGKYRLFKDLQVEPTTTVNTSGTGYAVATLIASLEGNVTGDLTGDVTGDVTGNLTGNVTGGTISGTTGTFSGNVDIDGTLDVDNVISVEGSGFGRVEVGGASGGYIDLKAPNSDDYDLRLITSTGGAELLSIDTLKFYTGSGTDLAITIDASQDVTFEGNIILSGTVDGRDVSTDGSKLDGIEAGADVTDTANVRSAGALMDDELTNISAVKAINQQLTTTSNVQFTSVTSDLTGDVTGNADTATKIASITNSNIVQLTDTQTLTNKTIDADNNTISDLEVDNLKAGVLDTDLTSVSASDDTLASAKAIKTYVDSQVGANNELSEVLANGNTTGGTDISVSSGDDITFADNSIAFFGSGNDFYQYHDGTNSYIKNYTGDLIIEQNTNDKDIIFKSDDGSGGVATYFQADGSTGAINLYHYGSKKFETTSTGVTVTGGGTFTGDVNVGANTNATRKIELSGGRAVYEYDTTKGTSGAIVIQGSANKEIHFETTADTPDMIIDSSGNVGIGTDSPDTKLEIVGNNPILTIRDSDTSSSTATSTIRFAESNASDTLGNYWDVGYSPVNLLNFDFNGSTKITINSSGNVGIGTTSPDSKLDVTGGDITVNTTGTGFMNFKYSGSQKGTIGTDGIDLKITANADLQLLPASNVGINTASPEEKLHVIGSTLISNNEFYKVENTTGTNYKIAGLTNGNEVQIGAIDYTTAGTIFAGGDNISITTGGASGTSRIKIDSTGNVGINNTNPTYKLDVAMTSGNHIARFAHSVSTGYAPASILLQASQSSSRGQGMYYYNTEADENWFVGIPYNVNSRKWIVANKYATDVQIDTAQLTHALLTVDSDTGNTGIGTTSPSSLLHIQGSTYNRVQTYFDGDYTSGFKFSDLNGGIWYDAGADDLILNSGHANSQMIFNTGGSESVRIDKDGRVGIGITPNAFFSGVEVLQLGKGMTLMGNANDDRAAMMSNLYLDANTAYRYVMDGLAAQVAIEDGNIFLRTATSGTAGSVATLTERMRITSSGNVTIGNSTYGSSLGQLRIINDAASSPASLSLFGYNNVADGGNYASIDLAMQTSGTGGNVVASIKGLAQGTGENASNLAFYTKPASGLIEERMRIDSSGNVGIGETSPDRKLHVNSGSTNIVATFESTDATAAISLQDNSTTNDSKVQIRAIGDDFNIVAGGSQRVTVDSSGNVGIGTTDLGTEAKLAIGATNANEGGQIVLHKGTSGTYAAHLDAFTSGGSDFLRILKGTNTVTSAAPFYFDLTNDRLGIGTVPSSTLTLNATGGAALQWQYNTLNYLRIEADSGGGSYYAAAGFYHRFFTSGSERMRIDSSGNVDITGGGILKGMSHLELLNNGGSDGTATSPRIYSPASGTLAFSGNGSERMRIQSNGNVAIGNTVSDYGLLVEGTFAASNTGSCPDGCIYALTTASSQVNINVDTAIGPITAQSKLHIGQSATIGSNFTTAVNNSQLFVHKVGTNSDSNVIFAGGNTASTGGTGALSFGQNGQGYNHWVFYHKPISTNQSSVGSISSTSTATSYNQSGSDERLKKNITDWNENILDKFSDIQPKEFNFNSQEDTEDKIKGFIAQNEVDKFPEAYPLVYDIQEEEERHMFNPSGMVVYLMKAVQELKAEIEQLKTQINN